MVQAFSNRLLQEGNSPRRTVLRAHLLERMLSALRQQGGDWQNLQSEIVSDLIASNVLSARQAPLAQEVVREFCRIRGTASADRIPTTKELLEEIMCRAQPTDPAGEEVQRLYQSGRWQRLTPRQRGRIVTGGALDAQLRSPRYFSLDEFIGEDLTEEQWRLVGLALTCARDPQATRSRHRITASTMRWQRWILAGEDPAWSTLTKAEYRSRARRFCRWLRQQGLQPETISASRLQLFAEQAGDQALWVARRICVAAGNLKSDDELRWRHLLGEDEALRALDKSGIRLRYLALSEEDQARARAKLPVDLGEVVRGLPGVQHRLQQQTVLDATLHKVLAADLGPGRRRAFRGLLAEICWVYDALPWELTEEQITQFARHLPRAAAWTQTLQAFARQGTGTGAERDQREWRRFERFVQERGLALDEPAVLAYLEQVGGKESTRQRIRSRLARMLKDIV